MTLRFQPVQVPTGQEKAESLLVFDDDALVAVLVQLSDHYGADAGRKFLEAGFGCLDHPRPPIFADVNEVQAWITRQLADDKPRI